MKKDYIMTLNESQFFDKLQNILGDKNYIFPQIHLSSIFNEKLKNGQDWEGARAHIEKKSVDYVVCDKSTKKILFAIELDDKSHEKPDRVARDKTVNELFSVVGIPLIRLTASDDISSEMFK